MVVSKTNSTSNIILGIGFIIHNFCYYRIIKYNPLLEWSLDQTKLYIKENNVPHNVLHDHGFISIGCQPCTRAIQPGDDIRAGRWWWEQGSEKECGLHSVK